MDRKRLNEALRDIAGRKKHVRFRELESLLDNHIGPLCPNYNHHGSPHHAFTVGEHQTFVIPEPKRTPFVKEVYVSRFLDEMEALGLYTEAD
jgi:hypothetical protein